MFVIWSFKRLNSFLHRLGVDRHFPDSSQPKFVKRLKDYALDRNTITPEFAIHAATGLTSETFGIKQRGFIREGYYADIIVFDPKLVNTKATFEDPDILAEGMIHVIVNGIFAVDTGSYTGKLPGRTLMH